MTSADALTVLQRRQRRDYELLEIKSFWWQICAGCLCAARQCLRDTNDETQNQLRNARRRLSCSCFYWNIFGGVRYTAYRPHSHTSTSPLFWFRIKSMFPCLRMRLYYLHFVQLFSVSVRPKLYPLSTYSTINALSSHRVKFGDFAATQTRTRNRWRNESTAAWVIRDKFIRLSSSGRHTRHVYGPTHFCHMGILLHFWVYTNFSQFILFLFSALSFSYMRRNSAGVFASFAELNLGAVFALRLFYIFCHCHNSSQGINNKWFIFIRLPLYCFVLLMTVTWCRHYRFSFPRFFVGESIYL